MSILDWLVIAITTSMVVASLHACFKVFKITNMELKDTSDCRSFDRGEIVWCGGSKYRVKSYTWCGDTLEIILTLDLGYGCELKVDSREVKKVQRVYAEVVSE